MDISTSDCLAIGFSNEFLNTIRFKTDVFPLKDEYNILLIGEDGTVERGVRKAETVICPGKINLPFAIGCNRVITCGMRQSDTLSFSCIDGDRAVLSLTRTVGKAFPGEVGVRYRKELTLYENLVYHALRLINIR